MGSVEMGTDGAVRTYAADILTLLGELLAAVAGRRTVAALARRLGSLGRLVYCGPSVSGGCMAIRASSFTELGGFSRAYFMYYEDTDLCARAIAAGCTVVRLAEPVYRHHNRSSPTSDDARELMIAQSGSTYLRRRFGVIGAATVLVLRIAASISVLLAMAATGARRRHARRYADKVGWVKSAIGGLRALLQGIADDGAETRDTVSVR